MVIGLQVNTASLGCEKEAKYDRKQGRGDERGVDAHDATNCVTEDVVVPEKALRDKVAAQNEEDVHCDSGGGCTEEVWQAGDADKHLGVTEDDHARSEKTHGVDVVFPAWRLGCRDVALLVAHGPLPLAS